MGDRVEFVVLTHWQSMDAIRSFAGASVDKAEWNRALSQHSSTSTVRWRTTL